MTDTATLPRHVFDVNATNERFVLKDKLYNKQFSKLYTNRLKLMQPHLR